MSSVVESGRQSAAGNPPASSAKDSAVAVATAPAFPQLSIWPPSQRTREAVIQRLVETLASPSVLSKRYGELQHDEASAAARLIEGEAFATAGAAVTGDSIEEGIRVLQIYSKVISCRVLDSARARVGLPPSSIYDAEDEGTRAPPSADASAGDVAPTPSESAASTVGASEEVASLESEALAA